MELTSCDVEVLTVFVFLHTCMEKQFDCLIVLELPLY